jgi:hypothetical protein
MIEIIFYWIIKWLAAAICVLIYPAFFFIPEVFNNEKSWVKKVIKVRDIIIKANEDYDAWIERLMEKWPDV